jgi:uncharacterized membrane protein
MRSLKRIVIFAAILLPSMALLAARASGQAASGIRPQRPRLQYMRGARPAASAAAAPVQGPPNMVYNGGAVLPNSVSYAIWWGKPSDFPADAKEALDDLLEGLEGSNFLHIADQYMLGNKAHTRFGGNFFDYSAPPPSVVDAQGNDLIAAAVPDLLAKVGLKPDPTAVYFVYTSNHPQDALFCGYHNYVAGSDGTHIHFAYVPNNTSIQSGCGIAELDPNFTPSILSGGSRAMASVTAHEFMESITDPNIDAWYTAGSGGGNEIGDPCAYTFQTWVPLENSKWRIQQIWSNKAGGCVPGSGREARILGAFLNSGSLTTFDIPAASYGVLTQSINASGAFTGFYIDAFNTNHAFVGQKNGSVTPFDAPGAVFGTFANSMNAKGAVTGNYIDANFVDHGYVRDNLGNFVIFDSPGTGNGTIGGTLAQCINDEGDVAGSYLDASLASHGFVRDKYGNFVTFDIPGLAPGLYIGANVLGINEEGVVIGNFLDANFVSHAFVRESRGAFAAFEAPGAVHGTFAFGVNEDGTITGYFTDAQFKNHGFVRDSHGLITTFDVPSAVFGTFAYAINSAGSIAGYYADASGFPHGFVRDKQGNFTKIDTPGKSYGTVLKTINDNGAVAGYHTAPTP